MFQFISYKKLHENAGIIYKMPNLYSREGIHVKIVANPMSEKQVKKLLLLENFRRNILLFRK
jgi:hypothetical protein